jgi:hypothetical protein
LKNRPGYIQVFPAWGCDLFEWFHAFCFRLASGLRRVGRLHHRPYFRAA